jgi:parallel beta-helix repeat protein
MTGGRWNFRVLLLALVLATWAFVSIGCVSAAEWHVYPGQSIQTAINSAGVDDVIYVHAGTYFEHVNVSKRLTLIGVDKPVVDAGGYGSAIKLSADGITLEGFTATNSGSWSQPPSAGIEVFSNHTTLTGNTVSNSIIAISLPYSSNNTLTGNIVSNNIYIGLFLYYSSNNTLTGNIVSNVPIGIYFQYSCNINTITGNTVNNTEGGIYLDECSSNTLNSNIISDNGGGIIINYGEKNTLTGNTFVANGLFFVDSYNNTVQNNTVNGKPLVYLEGAADQTITNAGQVILVRCARIRTEYVNASDTDVGLQLQDTKDGQIVHCDFSNNNLYGVRLRFSSNNTIANNTASSNHYDGISLEAESSNNALVSNTVFSNYGAGISVHYSNNNTIDSNTAFLNNRGIQLGGFSNGNIIANNSASSNNYDGVNYVQSSNNTLVSNTVSANNRFGIFLELSSNKNTIAHNTVFANNGTGISFRDSSDNIIANNTVSANNGTGISLNGYSNNNNTIANNYFNNTNNAYDSGNNVWNITKIQGRNIVDGSWLGGNYWSDYTGQDTNGDGLGDTLLPYNSSGNITNGGDWLPLVSKQPPIAVIDSIEPNPAKQGKDTISFIGHGNDSDGSIVAYNWTSNMDGLLNTSASFTKPASELSVGMHIIYFSVQDNEGAWSSAATENLTILTNQPPIASFTYSPVNPAVNETVIFNASSSLDSDGSIVSYNWSFGDGNVSNITEVIVMHSYSSVGNYTVNLTVTDDEGATNTTSRDLQICLKPPIATFACSPPNPIVNETVTFNASESYDPNGVITTYEFEFGDGTNGTGEVIAHCYSSVGTYTVNLTLTDDEGAMNRTSKTLKVFSNISYLDTEPGTYPSIPGSHNGTITMTHTVNVSKISIYPCAGTGGHIEYARIWNTSWAGAEARWDGYAGDWHNLSFDKNFTLIAGETYNYTIRTGSYPQIHHTLELLTAKGWITCEEFVDINGKRHEGWIPAIRLS